MAAKRTSVISILSALILIASFLSAILPQAITPQSVYAVTQEILSTGTWTVPSGVTSVQVLVVAGGGGGGSSTISYYVAGGGGAGGLIYNPSYAVEAYQEITVVVGAGGNGGSGGNEGGTGGYSQFGTIIAHGGGGGGGSSHIDGDTGGSGGGGMGRTILAAGNGAAGTSGEGQSGGNGKSRTLGSENAGGGGGGHTSAGIAGDTKNGGEGGTGEDYSDPFGTSVGASGWFAGGGGGGVSDGSGSTIGYGGTGGGGNGGKYGSIDATGGTDGTGGGGGGAGKTSTGGGNGGSGIVIIQYTSNSAPTIGTVALWTTGGSPSETTSMTPQVEYNIKVPVTDNDTLNDLVTVKATLYYDSDGTYSEGEVPTSGNTQTCAILTWTNGGSPSAWTIDPSSSTTWSIVTANCVQPTLSGTTGTFEFHFKPGKVATYTGGSDNWHIYVKATDSASGTGTGTKTDLTMAWYGEIVVNTGTVDWGEVSAGLDFAEGDPSEETGISITYICNGAYNQQVKADTSWSGSPSGSATLNTGGTPGANEFSLKADDDGTLDAAVTVSDSYQTFDTGTLTSESGNAETGNSLWLKLGTPCTKATYSGTMYYQIAH